MQADLHTLKRRVLETAKQSAVAAQIEDVVLEPDRDEEGTDFLRVVVQVKNLDQTVDSDFEALLEAIESTVTAVDGTRAPRGRGRQGKGYQPRSRGSAARGREHQPDLSRLGLGRVTAQGVDVGGPGLGSLRLAD